MAVEAVCRAMERIGTGRGVGGGEWGVFTRVEA